MIGNVVIYMQNERDLVFFDSYLFFRAKLNGIQFHSLTSALDPSQC